MEYDSKQLSLIVAQAAQHLHAVVSNIATALLDVGEGNERVLFSNSALRYINGYMLSNLARHYLAHHQSDYPCLYSLNYADDLFVYFIVLDSRHVFAVIGKAQDSTRIEEFSQRLGRLLPTSVQPA